MGNKTIYDWGQSRNLAPSIKRVDPWGWVGASLAAGLVMSMFALAVTWRPCLGWAAPPGALAEHLGYWAKLTVHTMFHSAYTADARYYREVLRGWSDTERVALIWRCALAVWCFFIPCIFLAGSYLRPRDGLIHLRGSTRHEGEEAVAHLNSSLRKRVERRPDHDIAPSVSYPADLWTRHVLVVGGTGSGKSTAIKPLIDKVVASGEQMLLFDPKSEFTEGFAKPAIIAPWDSRSLSWDIARDMRNPLDMRRFAATIIRESQDPMWSNASRQLLVGVMIYLKATRGTDWGWMELKELVAQPQARLLSIMKDWHPEAVRSVEKASVTTAGILINLSSFCSVIFDLAEAWGDTPRDKRVSFVEWATGKSAYPQIILQGHGAYAELTKSYVEGIVGIVSAMVNSVEMRDDTKRKIWFIADEFAQMGKIPVRPLFEVGRSRGVRCVIACQDFAQLEELYGAPMVKALIGMCGTMLIGQIMQGETAEQICKAFGAREVERTNMSSSSGGAGAGPNMSTTLSFNRDEVALYKPSELSSRLGLTPDGNGVVLLLFTGGHAYELVWPHYQIRSERAAFAPAPWTLGVGLGQLPEQSRRAQAEQESGMRGIVDEPLPMNLTDPAKRIALGDVAGGAPVADEPSERAEREAEAPSVMAIEADSKAARQGEQDRAGGEPLALASLTLPEAPKAYVDVRSSHPVDGMLINQSEEPEPMSEAMSDLAMRQAGLEALSAALAMMNAGGAAQDARSVPRQEVFMNVSPPTPSDPPRTPKESRR